jgi:hypothetical protein
MTGETPRDREGRRLCQHCLTEPVPPSLGTRPRSYCSRNCRQRAYETRKQLAVVQQAVAAALHQAPADEDQHPASSRDDAPTPASSRDDAAVDDGPVQEELPMPEPAVTPADIAQRPRPRISPLAVYGRLGGGR